MEGGRWRNPEDVDDGIESTHPSSMSPEAIPQVYYRCLHENEPNSCEFWDRHINSPYTAYQISNGVCPDCQHTGFIVAYSP
jgi:hypothetical protein